MICTVGSPMICTVSSIMRKYKVTPVSPINSVLVFRFKNIYQVRSPMVATWPRLLLPISPQFFGCICLRCFVLVFLCLVNRTFFFSSINRSFYFVHLGCRLVCLAYLYYCTCIHGVPFCFLLCVTLSFY